MRFDGAIAGLGSSSGIRVVLGLWASGPYGSVVDAMVETPAGHRVLIAPSRRLADFIAATYRFDEVRVEPTELRIVGTSWTFTSTSLTVTFRTGRRTAVGWLLSFVPRSLARTRWWCRLIDPIARRLRPGVRTIGTAGGGRREWYAGLDERSVVSVDAVFDGTALGGLRPIDPPVRFGFGSTPRRPSWVRVTSFVETATSPRTS